MPRRYKKETNKQESNSMQETVKENVRSDVTIPYTHKAYSIYQDEAGWYLVEIGFNAKTGESGQIQKKYIGSHKEFAMEAFRIEVGNILFG